MLLVGAWDRFRPVPPPDVRMSGDVNVAIAEFGSVQEGGTAQVSDTSSDLAESVYGQLANELAALEQAPSGDALAFDYEIMSPKDVGSIDGDTPAERAEAAQDLSERTSAHIVVHAILDESRDGTYVTTEFFITDPMLISGAEELAGGYQMGEELHERSSVSGNLVARRALRDALLERMDRLTRLIVGLSYFRYQDYESADLVFTDLEENGLVGPADGSEILHLFHGNALGRLDQLEAAEAQYQLSLNIDPDYARSQIGLAEVTYQRAHGGCDANTTVVEGVRQAIAGYETARASEAQTPEANIDVKAALGLGRAHLCLSMIGAEDSWDLARTELTFVANAYEAGDQNVSEMAAEAWSSLGLLEIRTAAGNSAALGQAVAHLENAIETAAPTERDDRRYLWYGFLGFAHCQLGHAPEAEDAYASAIELGPTDSIPDYQAALERSRNATSPEDC